jgi:ParB family chromosome partitioning protein
VRKLGYDRYQIISGERRFKASKLAGLKSIPAYIRVANDQGMLEMALVENIQRQNLNPLEIALSYKRLIDECSLTQEALSERVGKDRSTVTNFLRLLKLPPEIQTAIREGSLSMGHARAITGIDDVAKQLMIFREILDRQLNVRETENIVSQTSSRPHRKEKSKDQGSIETEKIRNILSGHFGTKISLNRSSKGNGKIVIPFENDEDLNRILELLNY